MDLAGVTVSSTVWPDVGKDTIAEHTQKRALGQECKKKERQVHAFNKLRGFFFLNLSQPCSLMKQWKLDYLFLSNHYQIHGHSFFERLNWEA